MNLRSKWFFLIFIGSILILITACTPCPATITVTKTADTNDGNCFSWDCSLREAVIESNTCPGPQTIEIPAGGYTLTIPGINEEAAATGDLDLTDDVTITGIGAPSIHGNVDRAFHIHPGVTVRFNHIWLADGTAIHGGALANEGTLTAEDFTGNYNTAVLPPGGMGPTEGGCIYNRGSVAIMGGQFLANTAEYGGAVYNIQNARFTASDVNFVGNEASGNGGAVNNDANTDVTITGSEFRMNQADVNGGAIWNHGIMYGGSLYFEDNHAEGNGGGIFNWHSSEAYFTNTWLTLNTADEGGAAYNEEGMLHFYQSGMTSNTAWGGAGGGVYNMGPGGGLLLRNTTLSANTAAGDGGGLYNTGQLQLRFITVADNSPDGIRVDGGAELKIRSSALADNSGANCSGIPLDSEGHNIENDGTCALTGWNDLPATDPLLEPLAPFAGMAPSHALGVGSPAIDSGDPDRCTALDQHGTTRPQGLACDRGAHENLYTRGIIRGWTYMDEDDDEVRDPGEGAVSGANLTLKDGPCPGGADILGATSDSLGFYEMVDIEPGEYCLATDPLQQTLDPVERNVSIAEGDILEDINFRYILPVPDASASGLVWHDLCAVPYSTPSTPPPGCVDLGGGSFAADGVYDPAEPGIPDLMVRIGTGECPITTTLTMVPTNADGEFEFAYLFGGATYCIEVDQHLSPWNDAVLLPGEWSYPERFASPAEIQISPAVNEDLTGINFGWDYLYLPFPPLGLWQCYVVEPAHLRFGPGLNYPIKDSYPEGYLVEILGKSTHEPLWLNVRGMKGEEGWISKSLVNCGETDFEVVESKPDPAMPEPTRDPNKKPDDDGPAPSCSPNLSQRSCIAAGGTWEPNKQVCLCP